MLVSLYDSAYLVEHETIMTNMIGYSNIHAYMQGKYIQSMFTETKTEEKVSGKVASFAMSEATKQATKEIARIGLCDTLEVAADGVPVCGIVHFLAWCWNNLWAHLARRRVLATGSKCCLGAAGWPLGEES